MSSAKDDYLIGCNSLDERLGERDQTGGPIIDCFDAEGAWLMLQHLRENCLVWHCGVCDAWIFTPDRPRIGVLRCSTCGDVVDFRHADRSVGMLE